MRVRPAAGLHGSELLRIAEIADVEYANASKSFRTDRRRNTLRTTVNASASLLDRHEEQIPMDRYIALSAGTHNGCDHSSIGRIFNRISREPAEIPHKQIVAAECDIRICKINP